VQDDRISAANQAESNEPQCVNSAKKSVSIFDTCREYPGFVIIYQPLNYQIILKQENYTHQGVITNIILEIS